MKRKPTATGLSDKLCECGCGERTQVIAFTSRCVGRIAGEPNRFIFGHQGRAQRAWLPRGRSPMLCACGCGRFTNYKNGTPNTYISGHHCRRPGYDIAPNTGCWIPHRTPTSPGGYFADGGTSLHRRAYAAAHGAIPPGLHVHHTCEDGRCINPAHLEAMTPREHHRIHAPKLDPAKVRTIRKQVAEGRVKRRIAGRFNVSPSTISDILAGRSWEGVA